MAQPAKKPGLMILIGGGPKGPRPKAPWEDNTDSASQEESPEHEAKESAPQEQAEHSGQTPPIKPEAVCAHSEDENCESCEYMLEDGTCSYLQIPVGKGTGIDWCSLYDPKEGGPEGSGPSAAPGGDMSDQLSPAGGQLAA